MARDYGEHLDASSMRLLAETTGVAPTNDASQFFRSRPHDIRVALGSPRAERLLDLRAHQADPVQHALLQLAVAVHRTAEDICQAGWIATDESVIDLNLLSFAGQSDHHHFLVGLLASYLRAPAPAGLPDDEPSPRACTDDRLWSLIDLCQTANETERAGALRLLGDEALFSVSLFPGVAHRSAIDLHMLDAIETVLPRAVVGVLGDLAPQLRTLLDVHLMFGPIWYRMAAQNLLFNGGRESLNNIARDFVAARRFLVQVAQGPLEPLLDSLYPDIR